MPLGRVSRSFRRRAILSKVDNRGSGEELQAPKLLIYQAWRGGRVVEGTGLENRQG
jgi:hypothetical protein